MSIYIPSKLNNRANRRPDFRNLIDPRITGKVLSENEIDYDDLVIHRAWRSFNEVTPGEVKYFMYEVSQRLPSEKVYSEVFFKAVRMIRLTRVPRYLRQSSSNSGPNMVFEQMRDVLAALREQGVLFVNLVAKSPQLPLIFAYGVQGVGNTIEEAQKMADEGYAVLDYQLSGTYQQLMYKPISLEEGEVLSRYQSEWTHLAMGRGRPLPAGSTMGTASILDGNRTDIESTNNQLESFIRGMSDKSFLLSLITVPLSPAEITFSWRNLTQKLSDVKSEINGSRSISAGVSLPFVMGASDGSSSSGTHSTGTNEGVNSSTGVNSSLSHGTNSSDGTNQALTSGINHAETLGKSQTITDGTNSSTSYGVTDTTGTTSTHGTSSSTTDSTGTSWSDTTGSSTAVSSGTNSSVASTSGTSSSTTNTEGTNSSTANGTSQGISSSDTTGTSASAGSSTGSSSTASGGILGNGGSQTNSSGTSADNGTSAQHTAGVSQGSSSTTTNGISASTATSLGSNSSSTNTNGISASTTQSTSSSHSIGGNTGTSLSQGINDSIATSTSRAISNTLTNGTSHSVANGISSATTDGTSSSVSDGVNASKGINDTSSNGTSANRGTNSGTSDAWAMAYSRSIATSGSLAVAPNFGVAVSRQTYDSAKAAIGDMLEAQLRRYNEGLKSGAFLYQMFLVCPDRETLVGGSGLLKSAFWGAGESSDQLPAPFHTITDFDVNEKKRLLLHAQAFTSYRKREDVLELIEPFKYSSYLTPTEGAALVHPPVVEGPGLLAVHDSMPVMRMPMDRQNCDITLGHIVNGERGVVSDIKFGVNVDDFKGHALIAGVTGSGKTTTLMRMLTDIVKIERTITELPTAERPFPMSRNVKASVLGLDWMRNMRNLASIPGLVESGRFRFYSIMKPELGAFKWNPLAVPAKGMTTAEWRDALADNFTAAFNLGEFGRSLIAEYLTDLYTANRLEPFTLRKEIFDDNTGLVLRHAIVLPAIPEEQIPSNSIVTGPDGRKYANCFTYPELSRCVSLANLATIVANKVEEAATVEGARLSGVQIRERLQSLWRRIQYFAPGGQYTDMLASDVDLVTKNSLGVNDLIDPDKGLISILETDGLDFGARRLILGSVLLAIYKNGLFHGDGVFDHDGKGPGCFVIMEESHELFGEAGRSEDAFSAETRTALYEGMFRRVRALGLRLIPVAQQPSTLPEAVTANVNTVFMHKVRAKDDRDKAFSLLNWSNNIGQQMREYRYLGELPTGYCIARLDAKTDYTESAPVQFKTEEAILAQVSDSYLMQIRF